MTVKKLMLGTALAALMTLGLSAQETTTKRTLTQAGAGLLGVGSGWTSLGAAVGGSVLTFADPANAEGLYYSAFADTVVAVDLQGQSLTDTKVLELGWRPALFGSPLRLDVHGAPTLGARSEGSRLLGSFYTGLAVGLGLWVPVSDRLDLGLTCESGLNLFTWGAPATAELTYTAVLVSLAYKSVTETKTLEW